MFDGIDVITLPAADVSSLRSLYVGGLGFAVHSEVEAVDPAWQQVWSLPVRPRRAITLSKPGSAGGWIRLVEVPGLPGAQPASRPDGTGPYALDFYLRGADRIEERIAAAGWAFRTEAVHYPLPGTDTGVRERMLVQRESGLLHAFVEYRRGQTRCVLDSVTGEGSSEVVAVVFFTNRFEQAKAFAQDILGARMYFGGRFGGPAVERLLGLSAGEGFPAALFRGPNSRNARLEFAETLTPAGPLRSPDEVPRVIAGCAVDDLDRLEARLADGGHGDSTGIVELPDGGCHLGFASNYGATFEFWQRHRS